MWGCENSFITAVAIKRKSNLNRGLGQRVNTQRESVFYIQTNMLLLLNSFCGIKRDEIKNICGLCVTEKREAGPLFRSRASI